jgi:hypothetical protein
MTNKQNPENPSPKHKKSFEILKAENLSSQYSPREDRGLFWAFDPQNTHI